jgi:uncharacterized RDD family membrane protein YckC
MSFLVVVVATAKGAISFSQSPSPFLLAETTGARAARLLMILRMCDDHGGAVSFWQLSGRKFKF